MTMVDNGLRVQGFRLDGVAVVVVGGEVDSISAPLLRATFDRLGPDEHVYVDCADVAFIDSDGLAPLCEMARRNVIAGGPLHVQASSALRRMVEISDMEHLFALH